MRPERGEAGRAIGLRPGVIRNMFGFRALCTKVARDFAMVATDASSDCAVAGPSPSAPSDSRSSTIRLSSMAAQKERNVTTWLPAVNHFSLSPEVGRLTAGRRAVS